MRKPYVLLLFLQVNYFFDVTYLMILIIIKSENRLKIAIIKSPEIKPEAITTLPSKTNKITESLKDLKKYWIKSAITSVPPVAQSWFKAKPIAVPTKSPPKIAAIILIIN